GLAFFAVVDVDNPLALAAASLVHSGELRNASGSYHLRSYRPMGGQFSLAQAWAAGAGDADVVVDDAGFDHIGVVAPGAFGQRVTKTSTSWPAARPTWGELRWREKILNER